MACPPFKRSHLLQNGVIIFLQIMTPHHCRDIQALQQDWDWKVSAHPAYSPNFAPYDCLLFPHIKKPLRGCRLNLQTISFLLSQRLCLLSTDEYRMQLISCHIGGKGAKFLEGIMFSTEHVQLYAVVRCVLSAFEKQTNPYRKLLKSGKHIGMFTVKELHNTHRSTFQ